MPQQKSPLLPIDDVRKLVMKTLRLKKLSRSSIYCYIQKKKFPRAIDLGTPRMWRRKEVEAWLTKLTEG